MSERFKKLYRLPDNLYLETSPVIVSAGALLKDNQTGKIIVQLKIKNISDKVIKAVKINIISFDTVGKKIEGETEYEYLDIEVKRDGEFGQKTAVYIENSSTRAFNVNIKEVAFIDNTVWCNNNSNWKQLNTPKSLKQIINNDDELLKQFKVKFGTNSKYSVEFDRDIWICTCGNINKLAEGKCHKCNCEVDDLLHINLSKLNEEKNARLNLEKINEKNKKKKTKKSVILCFFLMLILLASAILLVLLSDYRNNCDLYESAMLYVEEGEFDKAIEIYEELDGFKESNNRIKTTKYDKAMFLLGNEEYISAVTILLEIEDCFDSKKKIASIKNILYDKAFLYLDSGQSKLAMETFDFLGNYKDCKEMFEVASLQNALDDYKNIFGNDFFRANKEKYEELGDKNLEENFFGKWLLYDTSGVEHIVINNDGTVEIKFDDEWLIGGYWFYYKNKLHFERRNPYYYGMTFESWKDTIRKGSSHFKVSARKVNNDVVVIYYENNFYSNIYVNFVLVKENSIWDTRFKKSINS